MTKEEDLLILLVVMEPVMGKHVMIPVFLVFLAGVKLAGVGQ
jgi:hypothetical protein